MDTSDETKALQEEVAEINPELREEGVNETLAETELSTEFAPLELLKEEDNQ